MSAELPGSAEPNPAWDQFSEQLKAERASVSAPPSPNEVARFLAKAEAAGEDARGVGRWLMPVGAAAVVLAGVVTAALVLSREAPETPWVARSVLASSATTTGSVTETADDGRALFSLGDDTVGLGPGTRLEVASAGTKRTRLVLSRGSVAAHVDPARGARNFDVETPLGRVHVVGTIFRVRAVAEELTVEVQKGVVEVTHGDATSKVTAGQKLVVSRGQATLGAREGAMAFDELSDTPVAAVVPPKPEVVEPPDEAPEPVAVKDEPKKKSPTLPVSRVSEWRTRAARGECGLVMPEVKKFLAGTPDDVSARMTLADCQRRTGDKAGAVETYLKASGGKGPEANRATLMAGSLLQDELGQPLKALKQFERYLARGAESRELEASVLVRKARALEATGKKAAARQTLDLVVKKFSDTAAAADALRLMQ